MSPPRRTKAETAATAVGEEDSSANAPPLWERSKENTVPLSRGRNVSELEESMQVSETEKQRRIKHYRDLIAAANANASNSDVDDPLIPWLGLISYMQSAYPSSKHVDLLEECVLEFHRPEHAARYHQDVRFVKLCCLYASSSNSEQENPLTVFEQLHRLGIGSHRSMFWAAWAWQAERLCEYDQAEQILEYALTELDDPKPQPIQFLQQRYQQFQRRKNRRQRQQQAQAQQQERVQGGEEAVGVPLQEVRDTLLGRLSLSAVRRNDRTAPSTSTSTFTHRVPSASASSTHNNNNNSQPLEIYVESEQEIQQQQLPFQQFLSTRLQQRRRRREEEEVSASIEGEFAATTTTNHNAALTTLTTTTASSPPIPTTTRMYPQEERRKENTLQAEPWNQRGGLVVVAAATTASTSMSSRLSHPQSSSATFQVFVDPECAAQHVQQEEQRIADNRSMQQWLRSGGTGTGGDGKEQKQKPQTKPVKKKKPECWWDVPGAAFDSLLLKCNVTGTEQCVEEARAKARYYTVIPPKYHYSHQIKNSSSFGSDSSSMMSMSSAMEEDDDDSNNNNSNGEEEGFVERVQGHGGGYDKLQSNNDDHNSTDNSNVSSRLSLITPRNHDDSAENSFSLNDSNHRIRTSSMAAAAIKAGTPTVNTQWARKELSTMFDSSLWLERDEQMQQQYSYQEEDSNASSVDDPQLLYHLHQKQQQRMEPNKANATEQEHERRRRQRRQSIMPPLSRHGLDSDDDDDDGKDDSHESVGSSSIASSNSVARRQRGRQKPPPHVAPKSNHHDHKKPPPAAAKSFGSGAGGSTSSSFAIYQDDEDVDASRDQQQHNSGKLNQDKDHQPLPQQQPAYGTSVGVVSSSSSSFAIYRDDDEGADPQAPPFKSLSRGGGAGSVAIYQDTDHGDGVDDSHNQLRLQQQQPRPPQPPIKSSGGSSGRFAIYRDDGEDHYTQQQQKQPTPTVNSSGGGFTIYNDGKDRAHMPQQKRPPPPLAKSFGGGFTIFSDTEDELGGSIVVDAVAGASSSLSSRGRPPPHNPLSMMHRDDHVDGDGDGDTASFEDLVEVWDGLVLRNDKDDGGGDTANVEDLLFHHHHDDDSLPTHDMAGHSSMMKMGADLPTFGDVSCIDPLDENDPTCNTMAMKAAHAVEYVQLHKADLKGATLRLHTRSETSAQEAHFRMTSSSGNLSEILSTRGFFLHCPTVTLPRMLKLSSNSGVTTGQSLKLGRCQGLIVNELGRGAYGVVTLLEGGNATSGAGGGLAIKAQKPSGCLAWEFEVMERVQERLGGSCSSSSTGTGGAPLKQGYHNMFPTPFSFVSLADGALLGMTAALTKNNYAMNLVDLANVYMKLGRRGIPEVLAFYYTARMLHTIELLHSRAKVLHCDAKPDNWVLVTSLDTQWGQVEASDIMLVDFGRAVDLVEIAAKHPGTPAMQVMLVGEAACADMMCVAMRQGLPWSFDLDTFGICACAHVLLFGQHMELERRRESNGRWMPKQQPLFQRRQLQNDLLWTLIFDKLLNADEVTRMAIDSLPSSLRLLREQVEDYLKTQVDDLRAAIRHQATLLPEHKEDLMS